MGNPKQKWTPEEEEALRAGVAKYGAGKWKFIQRDPQYNRHLHSRSNIDLKDKWRNINAAAGQGSRTLKAKISQESTVTSPLLDDQTTAPALSVLHDSHTSKDLPDIKSHLRYDTTVIEGLSSSTSKESNGLDTRSLVNFNKQRVKVPQNVNKLLDSSQMRLVAREKTDKMDKCLEAAAAFAATSLVKAEDLSFQAAEAVMEAERIREMAEEATQILWLANEILERCIRSEMAIT
ncbi:hypothetical protein V2J09_005231 [Rumex salicifolius]